MQRALAGVVRLDSRTKEVVRRLLPGEIAVIDHDDLDELGAHGLLRCRPRAVVNCGSSCTGRFPNRGPGLLLAAGVPLLDGVGRPLAAELGDGDWVTLTPAGEVRRGGARLGRGVWLDAAAVAAAARRAEQNLPAALRRFLDNTLERARLEQDLVLQRPELPRLRTRLCGRDALIVARGRTFRQDLAALQAYIATARPVLVAVDGGADALLDLGHRPHLIIGDMDSISDRALLAGAELVVHAYLDGRAPGYARLRRLGLAAVCFRSPGTSEDAALLLAHAAGAALLVTVGSHTDLQDFLEKGRQGMASTLLVRLKVGPSLVDLKGLSRLYTRRSLGRDLLPLGLAACFPAAAVVALSPDLAPLLRLLWLKLQILLQGL